MSEASFPRKVRILPIIRSVRTRWRLRMAFRGMSIVLGAGFLAFVLSAYGLEAARFSPVWVTVLRIIAWSVVAVLGFVFLLRPLFRRITDDQVALYLEEHEPSLEAAILGAMEAERKGGDVEGGVSPALLERLVERAVDRARAVDYGRRVDGPGLVRGSGALVLMALAVLLFFAFGPRDLRYGVTALALPTTEAAEVSPYSISVLPGDVAIARGSDQRVTATLHGFDSEEVVVVSSTERGGGLRRVGMLPADSGAFELLLLNLVENTEYHVESNGIRSPSYLIEVADLPYVEEMSHTYVFPDYTGLEPRTIEGGGDIAALRGTRVEMTIRSSMATSGGRLLVGDSAAMELTPREDGTLEGTLEVRKRDVYRIELARADGGMVEASPEYTIDVLDDLAPTVAISEPGRDAQTSAIEEVFVEARADDDYGIERLDLVYSVNGEPDQVVSLYRGGGSALKEVSAGHTLFLEEWEMDPGDVVSYYAVARDNRSDGGRAVMSDIYFLTIRPFRRDFRQAEQRQTAGNQAPGGQAPGGGSGSLSELQREVVAATFNLLRDEGTYGPEELRENLVSVALAQDRVRTEVSSLLDQMNARGVSQSNESFQEIARLLPEAIQDMETAENLLRQERTREALAPEQRALRFLQKAEETYERTVGQQPGGGGGGGGGGASAEELADLFEMELDKLQNQYETVQRGERRQASEEVDELMQKLKELARRQQQELERQRRRAEARQSGGGGSSGDRQRALAEEAEEAARQLAELSRESGDRELAETARRLQEAAETMRRSAAGSGQTRGLAEAASALDELEEAQRRLERNREGRLEEGMQDVLNRADELAESQEEVREGVEGLPDDPEARREAVRRIQEAKDDMVRQTQALERELFRMEQSARQESRETSQELGEALDAIREGRLEEKLSYTKGVVEQRDREFALDWEDQIGSDIEGVRERIQGAARAFQEGRPDRTLEEALDGARELTRGAESLGRRLEARGNPEASREGRGQASPGETTGHEEREEGQERGRRAQGSPAGEAGEAGGATRGDPVPFTEEEIRQYTREFAQRLEEARELEETLMEAGRESPELEEAMEAFDALRERDVYDDLPQVELLQRQIRESLKRMEFLLRRDVEGEAPGRAALTGSDEVPPGFRAMVEEYFRNLARGGGG